MRYESMISMGVILSVLFGNWGEGHRVLLILICIDYLSGVCIALMGHSKKTENGGFSSYTSWTGILRKVLTILIVAAAHQCDLVLGTAYIANVVIYGLCANELLSIIENYSMSGAKVPQVFYTAIEALKGKGDNNEDSSSRGSQS